ncbi:MAG: extensin family protein [Alphaproteobacteria bacterium]|nr:MAG: extensin family protein [Alphaproteobacteria bacterium]
MNGCGVSKPVRVVEVAGVPLTQGAIMDCTTAKALKSWVQNSVKPTVGRLGGGVASIKVIASYSCRTRNSKPGAKLSEHAKGKAVDVAAINLRNGIALTVLRGWRDEVQGPLLHRIHAGACGPFGTVLGPDADRYHQDHLHLDTASYRGGPYCR